MKRIAPLVLMISASLFTATDVHADSDWQFSGDARGGYFATERTARDGAESDADEFKLRLRFAAERGLSENLTFRGRVAGTGSSEQETSSAYLRGYPTTRSGLASGEATLDEFYLHYAPGEAGWSLRAGRMQTGFALPGVASKGMDRNDSPNVDVTWTDGLHFTHSTWLDGWNTHLILQHNHEKGASVTTRGPLDFTESGSRASLFVGLEAGDGNPGAIIQRVIGFTFMPDALATENVAVDRRDDYITLDAKLAAAWPLESGRRIVVGIETAYAFNTPDGLYVGTGETDSADGLAWQLAGSIYDIAPGHHLGVVTGRTGAGWLLSPDFRNNDELHEIRYQWKFSRQWSMEARYRIRRELDIPDTAGQAREDRDIYIRVSGRF